MWKTVTKLQWCSTRAISACHQTTAQCNANSKQTDGRTARNQSTWAEEMFLAHISPFTIPAVQVPALGTCSAVTEVGWGLLWAHPAIVKGQI